MGAGRGRLRGLIVILWRAGLRIREALLLAEADLDHQRGALLVRRGKGGRRREVGMDAWGWEELRPWLELRVEVPVGPLFCVINGPTRYQRWSSTAARAGLRTSAVQAGVRRRFAPHQLRHAHAIELAREGVSLIVIQRQLGHSNPRHHIRLPAGHRQRRDHRDRPRPPPTNDPRQHVRNALTPCARRLPVAQSEGPLGYDPIAAIRAAVSTATRWLYATCWEVLASSVPSAHMEGGGNRTSGKTVARLAALTGLAIVLTWGAGKFLDIGASALWRALPWALATLVIILALVALSLLAAVLSGRLRLPARKAQLWVAWAARQLPFTVRDLLGRRRVSRGLDNERWPSLAGYEAEDPRRIGGFDQCDYGKHWRDGDEYINRLTHVLDTCEVIAVGAQDGPVELLATSLGTPT